MCGVLRVDRTTALVTESVVAASGSILIRLAIDRSRAGERVPSQRTRCVGHAVMEPCPPQRRHRKVTLSRSLEPVAARADTSPDISGLSGDTDLALHPVVERLEFVVSERPVLHRGAARNPGRSVTLSRLGHHPEVPRIEPPTLGPVVQSGPTHCVHHGVATNLVGPGSRCRAGRGPLLLGLLHQHGPIAIVVPDLVRGEVALVEPGPGLEPHYVQPGLRQRQCGNPTRCAHPHDDDVGPAKLRGHSNIP